MQGTFTFRSSSPISVVALRGFTNERSEFLITTLPVSSIGGGSGNSDLLIPHFASGGGWTTQIILTNPTDFRLEGTVQFFGRESKSQSVLPLTMLVNGINGTTFNYLIPPRSAVRLATESTDEDVQVGSVRVVSKTIGTTPSALAMFSLKKAGVTITNAGVPALPLGSAFQVFVESTGGPTQVKSVETSLAIANSSLSPVTVNLDITRLDGTYSGLSTSISIPARGQISQFTKELFPSLPPNFQGILRLTADAPVAVSGLRGKYNERGDFLLSTISPWNEASFTVKSEPVFPHIVSGGGYTTEFIVFGALQGHPSNGDLLFMSDDGLSLSGVDSISAP
jgi:hypothetical protein